MPETPGTSEVSDELSDELSERGVPMSHFRFDALLLAIGAATLGVAYLASTRTATEAPGDVEIPELGSELEVPPIELPPPAFVFHRTATDRPPGVQRPGFSDPIETALVQVRSELLASSIPREAPHPSASTDDRRSR